METSVITSEASPEVLTRRKQNENLKHGQPADAPRDELGRLLPQKPKEVPLPAVLDELDEMEAMLRTAPAKGESTIRKRMRKELEDNYTAFMDRRVKLKLQREKELERLSREAGRAEVQQGPCPACEALARRREEERNLSHEELMARILGEALG